MQRQELYRQSHIQGPEKNGLFSEKGFLFMLTQQGRQNTKTTLLFALLAIALSTAVLFAYANSVNCVVGCQNDSQCDDQNPNTIDVCNNDGECGSDCKHIHAELGCQVECSSDSQCDDQNPETTDVCNNDATCEAECTNIRTDGKEDSKAQSDENQGCTIACTADTECDDQNPETTDVCNNDATCQAECTNLPVQAIGKGTADQNQTTGKTLTGKKQVLPQFSLKDLEGEKIDYGLKVIDSLDNIVESRELPKEGIASQAADEETPMEAGTYNIELEIDTNPVKKISLQKAVIDSNADLLEIQLLPDTQTPDGTKVKEVFLLNPASQFETGEMQLLPPSQTNALLKCKDWDSTTNTCNEEWQTVTTFENTGQEITISISPEDPVFGFAQITIINVQSYPSVGGLWEVMFETVGKADLTIKAVESTTWSNENQDEDLLFQEIRCGSNVLPYQWIDDSVLVPDYECSETGYETSKVLTAGKHDLEFKFGDDIGYAHNLTDVNVYSSGCWANDNAVAETTWLDPCDGTVTLGDPSTYLGEDDAGVEYENDDSKNKYAGVYITTDGWAVGDCDTIQSVTLYYKWWGQVAPDTTDYIQVYDGEQWIGVVSGIPNPNEGAATLTALDVTTLGGANWECADFAAAGGAGIRSNLLHSPNTSYQYYWDVLHFVVVYNEGAGNSCTCPSSDTWNIVNGDVCTLASVCSLSAGSDLHIVDGSLVIVNGAVLSIPSGGTVIIDEVNDANLAIESGGKLVIHQ